MKDYAIALICILIIIVVTYVLIKVSSKEKMSPYAAWLNTYNPYAGTYVDVGNDGVEMPKTVAYTDLYQSRDMMDENPYFIVVNNQLVHVPQKNY